MKALLLFCILAFASANFTPYWYDCGNTTTTNVFTPTNVTVQQDPKNETKTLISYCGTVNSHEAAATIIRKFQVDQIDNPWRWIYDQLTHSLRLFFKINPFFKF